MNYHIITQDKFFDAYIEDIYKLHQENNNVFWVRGNKGDTPYLKTKRPVEYILEEHAQFVEKLRTLKPEDKLFVSSYDMFIGQAILDSGISNVLYTPVMGWEFFADPFWYHADWLYDKNTFRSLKKDAYYGYPQINWKRRPKNWKKIYNELVIRHNFKSVQYQLYLQKMQTVNRIDYVILPEEEVEQFALIQKLYPQAHFKHVYGSSFSQNFEEASMIPTKEYDSKAPLKILIGNSADPSNNYLDAFEWLSKHITKISKSYRIYSILSYGDSHNKEMVISTGEALFGDSFEPIISFMDRAKYMSFLNDIDIVIMYHNRPQANGNIMTTLVMGKPVFLKATNTIYGLAKYTGISSVYDVDELPKMDIEKAMNDARADRDKNSKIISSMFSEEVRLNCWKELL